MTGLKYNAEITLGHLIQLIAGLAAIAGLYAAFDRRVTILETQLSYERVRTTDLINRVESLQNQQIVMLDAIAKRLRATTAPPRP